MSTDNINANVPNGSISRENGFYWVKLPLNFNGISIHWQVAYFDKDAFEHWHLHSQEIGFFDAYFLEINEDRIIPPN